MDISLKIIIENLNSLKQIKDDRNLPDERRRGVFKKGWNHSLDTKRVYKESTLTTRITWMNLGYRFGEKFGALSEDEKSYIFDVLAENFKSERGIISKEDEIRYTEGKLIQRTNNHYERNPKARKDCLDHFGAVCQICLFDFHKMYGEIGKGFIHVHHLEMISKKEGKYVVNPIKDLIPVCPNCHSMIHIGNECRSIEKMKKILEANKK